MYIFFLIFFSQSLFAQNNSDIDFDSVFGVEDAVSQQQNNTGRHFSSINSTEASIRSQSLQVPSGMLTNYIGNSVKSIMVGAAEFSGPASYCLLSKNEDMKNTCIAQVRGDKSFCLLSKNEDMKNTCIAQVRGDKSFCLLSKNEDMKNTCIAQIMGNQSYCLLSKNEDTKNTCIAQVRGDKSFCLLSKNEDMKNTCIAQVRGD